MLNQEINNKNQEIQKLEETQKQDDNLKQIDI